MIKQSQLKKIIILFVGDAFLLYAALWITLVLRQYVETDRVLVERHLLPFTIVFAVWLIMFGAFGFYDLRFMKNGKVFLYRLLRVMATNAVLATVILYFLPLQIEPRRNLFIIILWAIALIFVWRYFFNVLIMRSAASRVIFFGLNKEMVELADYLLKNPQLGQKPVAFLSDRDGNNCSHSLIPQYTANQDLVYIIKDTKADTVVINSELKTDKAMVSALFKVIPLGVSVIEFPAYHERLTGKIPLSLIGEMWFLENLIGTKQGSYEFFKRSYDITIALIAGTVFIAIFPLVAAAIKIVSPGPVFFRQKRMGRNGKIFELLKFRSTYRTEVPKNEGWTKEGEKNVYTAVGKFIRKSYIDELPQLINIFKGDMSFVGPRPERPEFVEKLKQDIPFYETRLLVPPGITGWAQVNMENDASVEDTPEKMQYDLYYIKNRSPVLDLLIILKTIFSLLHRQGK